MGMNCGVGHFIIIIVIIFIIIIIIIIVIMIMIRFHGDGSMRNAELNILNLRLV